MLRMVSREGMYGFKGGHSTVGMALQAHLGVAQDDGEEVSAVCPNKEAPCPRASGETSTSFKVSRYGNGS